MRIVSFVWSALCTVVLATGCSAVQPVASSSKVARNPEVTPLRTKIQTPAFTFVPSQTGSARFPSVQLTSEYRLRVGVDSLVADLPYFGQAYTAQLSPDDAGYRFVSTRFERTLTPGRRSGEWQMLIKTLDTRRPLLFRFTLWENGTASLSVSDPDRQACRYEGSVE